MQTATEIASDRPMQPMTDDDIAKGEEMAVDKPNLVNPFSKAVCLALSFRKFGVRRKADTTKIETKADKDYIRVSKLLLDSPELEKITSLDAEVTQLMRKRCLPSLLRRGVYLVPKGYVVKLDDLLRNYKQKRLDLVQDFLLAYTGQKEAAAQKLEDQFNPLDYPSIEAMERQFGMSWNFLKFGTPEELNEIDPDIAREEQEKLAAQMREAGEELIYMLRAEAVKKISHLVDRLSDTADGKKKRIYESSITNVEEFLEFFDFRNITGDESLAKLIQRARDAMSGVEVGAIKSNEALRATIRERLSGINEEINKLVEATPRRSVSFDED